MINAAESEPQVDLNRLTDGLLKTEFEIEGTLFFVSKLPSMEAWHFLDRLRRELGRSALNVIPKSENDEGAGAAMFQAILHMFLSLEPGYVDEARKQMFEKVEFANSGHKRQKLAGAEDFAFNELGPMAVYEVLVRSFAVNFTNSLRKLVSSLGQMGLIGDQPSQ